MRSDIFKIRTGLLTAGCLAAALAGNAWAQEPEAASEVRELRQFQVAPTSSPIRIDGVLDDAGWESATVVDLPYEWFPSDNGAPPVKTEALVTFDEDNLYVAFKAEDPDPGAIRAQLMDRDLIGTFVQDDHVGFTIDTFNDERQGFQFRVNPRGVQVDGVFSEIDGAEDFSWDSIWASGAQITDTGYVVEVAVPFRQIRFPRTTGPQTWGLEAFRNYPRSVRHRISSKFTDRAKDCTLCQENKLTGFQGIAPGRNLELTPTATAARTDEVNDFPDGGLDDGDEEFEPGLTAKWGVTPNMTLSATINPDFSQVEADALQLGVNTRFALFFPEKRPFFLEGADLYLTPLQAVFTRTIAEPSWGVKLNAKEDRDAYGLFVARDDITNIIIPGNQGSLRASLDESVLEGVFRYRRDLGTRSALGVLYTGREGQDEGEYHNRVGGLDGFFRLTQSDTVRVQYLASDTLYPVVLADALGEEAKPFSGDALSVQYDHFAKVWKGFVRYADLDPQFRADSGFIPRVDVKTGEGQYQRFFYGTKDTWYAQASFGVHGLRTEDHVGTLTDQTYEVFGTVNGPLQSAVELRVGQHKEFFQGTTFDLDRQEIDFGINPTGRVRFAFYTRLGDEIDLATARLGETIVFNPALQFRLGKGLNMQLEYARQELDVDGERAFDVDIAQSRIVYQFNVRTFVRAILQYQDFTRGAINEEDVFGQFLFSYKINPQTVLFAGYDDTRFGVNDISITQTGRSFFLKVGYALLY
ncbi:MAG TPA: DUF5916 domain-containing protein [Thermoanaerobaculia bacterium]|nr:DUF5916 domain-containing protein [Thermoanaerobaculia bacterium]